MRASRNARILIVALLAAAFSSACADAVEVGSGAAADEVGQVSAAQDQSTQSELHSVLITAMTAYGEMSSYESAVNLLPAAAPGICVVPATTAAGPSGGCPTTVNVYAQGSTFAAAAMSQSGHCFWIKTEGNAAPTYGSGSPCTGMAALGATAPTFPGS